MTRWEYHTVTVGADLPPALNRLGADGWDLVAILPLAAAAGPASVLAARQPPGGLVLVLKRPVEEPVAARF
jgi:hypothetical protein